MKKIFMELVIFLTIGVVCVSLTACNKNESKSDFSYVALRINPEVELVVEDNKVVATNAINEDGEIVLAEITLEGQEVTDAVNEFTDTAIDLGYLYTDNEEARLNVEVSGTDEEVVEKVKENINLKVGNFFKNNGYKCKFEEENLENDAELVAKAEAWGIDLHMAKLVSRVIFLYPEMTEEEVLVKTEMELIILLKDNKKQNGITYNLMGEYRKKIEAVVDKYSNMFELKEEIKKLSNRLETEELTEGEQALLEEEIKTKQGEYKALFSIYKEEITIIKSEYKQASKQAMIEYKNIHKEMIENNKKNNNTDSGV